MRFPHLYKECFVSSPTDVRSHNPPPFEAQRPRWGFHTLIKNDLFFSLIDVRFHKSSPSGPSVLTDTRSLLQSMWDPPIHSSSRPSVLAGPPPCSTPLQGSTSSLGHRPVSDSDTNYNGPSPRLANIVLFGLFLEVFKTYLLGEVSTPL